MCSWMNYRKAPVELNEATFQATKKPVFEIIVLFSTVLVPQGCK